MLMPVSLVRLYVICIAEWYEPFNPNSDPSFNPIVSGNSGSVRLSVLGHLE